jgi:hypothetical protein
MGKSAADTTLETETMASLTTVGSLDYIRPVLPDNWYNLYNRYLLTSRNSHNLLSCQKATSSGSNSGHVQQSPLLSLAPS